MGRLMRRHPPEEGPRQPLRAGSSRHRGEGRPRARGGLGVSSFNAEQAGARLDGNGDVVGSGVQDLPVGSKAQGMDEVEPGEVTSVGAAAADALRLMALRVRQKPNAGDESGALPSADDPPSAFQPIEQITDGAGAEIEVSRDFLIRWRAAVRREMGAEEFEKFCLSMRQSHHRRDPDR